jgi:hypothetical protein
MDIREIILYKLETYLAKHGFINVGRLVSTTTLFIVGPYNVKIDNNVENFYILDNCRNIIEIIPIDAGGSWILILILPSSQG